MDNATPRKPGAKMTIEVFTVSREGIVTSPRATVSVQYGEEPQATGLNPPCACPRCRTGQAVTR